MGVGKKLSEEEVKEMVAKVEGKGQNMRGDIADMALSEQYLRTKQALLMSKKKEQEMKIAQKMATIREDEVAAMKEKVSEKKELDKRIEQTRRRENYVENKIMETVL